jgi:transcriptional regulator with XRE-family HTH domain
VSVGTRIRDQREARKMSQAELAKQVGLSSAAIWNWETKGRVPRPQVLAKVAEALNVSEQYLTEGRNIADPNATQLVAERAPPAPSPEQGATITAVLDRTRMRIAELTGFAPDQIKLTLTAKY